MEYKTNCEICGKEILGNDIAEWSKKVKPGGIVSGHDYSNYMREVRIAVDAFVEVKRIKPWFITNHHRCWFWVKGSEVEHKRQSTCQE